MEVSKKGYRNFKTGILRIHGAKGHYIPTRPVLPLMPYPELVTFDDWDALYTKNVFNIGIKNTRTHALHIRIVNIGEDEDGLLMLYDKTGDRVLCEVEDFSDDGVLEGVFRYEFLRMDGPNALTKDMDLAIRFECRDLLFEFPLAIELEEAVFDEPTEVKDIIAKPLDTFYTEGVDIPLPGDFPLGSGLFQLWLPEFPVSIFCDPSGYVQLTMRTPSFGYKNDFGNSEDNGWQFFPRQSAAEQCKELKDGWDKAFNETSAASSRASGVLTHAKFTPKLTANVNVLFMAIANWNMEQKYFQGDAVMQFLLSLTISLTEQFFAGPVPMYINFTFIGQAMANYDVGFTVPLPEGDTRPNLVHVISAIDKYQWDYTNTGLSFQFLIKPSLSVGVGIKGVASVCLLGEIKLTYFIGVTYRGDLDKKKYPLPHQIATYSFKAEVVIEFFLFTRRWKLWEHKNDNWYNNWKGGLSTQGVEGMAIQGIGSETLQEFLDGMRPVTDDMLRASAEFEGGANGLSTQGEDDEDASPMPVIRIECREEDIEGTNGETITYAVYTVGQPAAETAAKTQDETQDDKPTQDTADEEAVVEEEPSDVVGVTTLEAEQNLTSTPETGGEGPTDVTVLEESDDAVLVEEEPSVQNPTTSGEVSVQDKSTPAAGEDQSDVAEPITYAIPSYAPLWDHETDSGIRTMDDGEDVPGIGDAPGVSGIGERGGIRPNLDVRLFDEPIYGNPRVQLVNIGDEVIALRIGSVFINGNPHTRLIATVVSGSLRPTGRSQVLDFPLAIAAELAGDYTREDLYDYEFSAATSEMSGQFRLQTVVVSGLRSDTASIAHAATDLVFSYVQFVYNDKAGGNPFSSIFSFVSWPGSKIYPEGDGYAYHCVSNVHVRHVTYDSKRGTEYIFYLDRAGTTEAEALGEDAVVRFGFVLVKHKNNDTEFDCIVPKPSTIRNMMGDSVDPTAYEMVFWPLVDSLTYFMIRGLEWASYYAMMITADGIMDFGNGPLQCFGRTEGNEVLRFWKPEAYSIIGEIMQTTPKCLSCKADGQLAAVHVKSPTSPEFAELEYSDIGPADFGASSFGIWGDFVYWPTSRVVDEGSETELDEYGEENEVPASNEYRIMASRLWNNKFSDPFILAEVDHRIDNIVSVSGTAAALAVVSSEIEDIDNNTGTLWYTSVPFVRTGTIIGAECEMPFVVPGGIAEFFVTIRNDGNTYIKGCVVEMYDEADKDKGDEWEPCGYAQVGFEYELVASVYNPPDADGNPTNAEEDGALAPGKIGVYRTLMMVPMEWEGSHRITFVGAHAFYDMVEDYPVEEASVQSEALQSEALEVEGIENVVFYRVKPGDIPMDVLTVRVSHTAPIVMDDAPVSVIGWAGNRRGTSSTESSESGRETSGGISRSGGDSWSGGEGGSGSNWSVSSSVNGRSTLPYTADKGSGALAGGIAAAGAAMLAYERRRAKNEGK